VFKLSKNATLNLILTGIVASVAGKIAADSFAAKKLVYPSDSAGARDTIAAAVLAGGLGFATAQAYGKNKTLVASVVSVAAPTIMNAISPGTL
jgi:hypothetical protein